MLPVTVEELMDSPSDDAVHALLSDRYSIFWIDWREEDDLIAEACENVLRTGTLYATLIDTETDPGFDLIISYKGRQMRVPLMYGRADRHITIHALNELLAPDFEIRVCVDSKGKDSLAFLPLESNDWKDLESRFGSRVQERFRRIQDAPNFFTDAW